MKIVMITNLYPPLVRGGAEVVAARMAEGLSNHLQQVVVVTTMPFASWHSFSIHQSNESGITIYRFFPLNVFYYLNIARYGYGTRFLWRILDIFNLHSLVQVARILNREKPDVVITHNLTGMGMLHPILLACMRIRHIHLVHDVQLVAPSGVIMLGKEFGASQGVYAYTGYVWLMRFIFSKVRTVISPSQFLLTFYTRYGFFRSAKKIILQNPIAQPRRFRIPNRTGHLRLLYVGSVSRAKGVALLLNALRAIPHAAAVLNIVGTVVQSQELRTIAGDDRRITFHGWVGSSAVEQMLVESDILVVPSILYDNSPTVVYEALSHGVPVLVSDLGGAQEAVQQDVNGWVFPAGDQAALSKIILDLSQDRHRVERAACGSIPSIAACTVERYTGQLLTVIQNDTP
ncbi:MAG: glycosyltransferase [Candidatus Komeilibacteria bacterium]|nr:glycosyltransferase [Candidatus Komeilibacteria bacterium]